MSPLLPTRRAEFAAAVDDGAPARRADLRALVEIVREVRAVPPPPLRSSFDAGLRSDLLAAAHRELEPRDPRSRTQPEPRHAPRKRRLVLAASAFVVAGGGMGVVATSAAALPGDLLYPVKRATERVDLAVHTDDSETGRLLLEHAQIRLGEAQELLTTNSDALVASTLEDFTTDAVRGSETLLNVFGDSGDETHVETVRSFAASAATSLETLSAGLPPSSDAAYSAAAAAVTSIDSVAVGACPDCAGGVPAVTLDADDSGGVPEGTAPPAEVSPSSPPDTGFSRPDEEQTAPADEVPQPEGQAPNLPGPNVPAPNVPAPDVPAPNVPGPNAPGPSQPNLPAPDLPETSLPLPSGPAPGGSSPSVPVPSLPVASLPVPSLPVASLPVSSLPVREGSEPHDPPTAHLP